MRALVSMMGLLLGGCGVGPEDLFNFRGLVSSSGQPVRENPIELARGKPIATGTSSRCAPTKTLATSSTDAQGRFRFEQFRAEVDPNEATTGLPACVRLAAELEGASSWIDLGDFGPTTDVGTLDVWRPEVGLTGDTGDGGLVLAFDPQPPVPESLARRVRASLVAVAGDGLLWDAVFALDDAGVARIERAIPAQWLEDREATLRLEAEAVGSVITSRPLDPTLSLATSISRLARFGALTDTGLELSGGLRPPSRGAACPSVGSPCPLTDGALTWVPLDGGTVIELTLEAPTEVRKVALRSRRYLEVADGSPHLSLDVISLVGVETGDVRVLAGFDADAGMVGPLGEGVEAYGAPPFFGRDGYFLLEVHPPLPAQRRFKLVFALPLEHLAEVSLFDR